MDGELIWILILTVATLANGIVLLIKNKKGNPGDHGERIARLEEAVSDLKEEVRRIKDWINGMRK